MKFIFKLGVKNLLRYKERTFLTCLSLAAGVCILLFFNGMLEWADDASIRNLKKYETASMKIGNAEFFEEENYIPIEEVLKGREKIEKVLNKKGLKYTPEIKFKASLINEVTGDSYPFFGMGIEIESHRKVYDLHKMIYEGDLPVNSNEIMIGKNTAELLNVKVGEYLIVEADTKTGAHNADAFKLVALFETPNPEVNKNFFYISIDAANDLLAMNGEINLISVKTEQEAEKLSRELKKEIDIEGMTVRTWGEQAQDYMDIREGKRGGTSLMLMMTFIIIVVGIANTMNMAVFERTGEIGMMRAMGMTDREIFLNFIFESGGLGFLGGILGLILGAIVTWYLIQYGWDMSSYAGDISYGYRVSAVFRSKWDFGMMITAVIFTTVSASVISIFPARRALKRSIAETLKSAGKFG
jgi:ABC-type lipoprotein release transport system permease subunit